MQKDPEQATGSAGLFELLSHLELALGEPTAEFCSVHHTLPETVPTSVFRLSGHFGAALRAISRYREMHMFKDRGWLH